MERALRCDPIVPRPSAGVGWLSRELHFVHRRAAPRARAARAAHLLHKV